MFCVFQTTAEKDKLENLNKTKKSLISYAGV